MLKIITIYQYINFTLIKRNKVQTIADVFTIFIFIFSLMMGSTISSWDVYGQTNGTDIQSGKMNQNQPVKSQEDKVYEIDLKQLTDESVSLINTTGLKENQNLNIRTGIKDGAGNSQPDNDCLFDPSLDKCAPDINGNCPQGFNKNENEQCFPAHDRCPSEYHSHEDDETGKCIPDNVPCEPGYVMNHNFPTCESKESICQKYPNLRECKDETNRPRSVTYNSGYAHGCSDAKISDTSKRYISQPEKGPNFHTSEFMRGYDNGFEVCTNANDKTPSNPQGSFKIIIQVTNQLPSDIYGGLTVSINHYPENIFKAAYDIYFPAGQTVLEEFTFKSSEVPVGTKFEVNLDYGDDFNQYIFGINTPIKKTETVFLYIS